ncbi:MAG: hypothetical protein KatS3mg104_1790 [Phycisphaerae bacterium]|jgi:ParB/RepB/Spo0J family partition protein|nr:MAG: hypothetical protein KatS3mg104_1790 [Phycisphaerae bacterium]
MKLPEGKNRLDLVRSGLGDLNTKKRGRLIVALDKLKEDPRNERKTFRRLDELATSIRAAGLVEPLTVTPDDTPGVYRILTGHRRFRAAKLAGLTEVEVIIRDPEDELTRRQKSIISNVQREDIGPVEMAEALRQMMDEDPRVKSQDDLAKLIGKDKSWVSGMLRILDLPTELRREVGTSQLPVPYESMIRIARLDDPHQQRALVGAALGGASHKEIRERIDTLKGKSLTTKAAGKSASPSPLTKPKQAYATTVDTTVVIQSHTDELSKSRIVRSLEEALKIASGN